MGDSKGVSSELVGVTRFGILFGLEYRLPASGLTAVYDGGYAKVKSAVLGKDYDEYPIAAGSKLFTASKDTYVYINGADGVLTYLAKTNGATKPTQADIGENSQLVAKVVTDGTNITAVQRLKREASHGRLHRITFLAGFASTTVGDQFYKGLFGGRILAIRSAVTTALAGTDVGTVTLAIGKDGTFTAVTGGVLTIAISAALSERDEVIATAANYFAPGDEIKCTSAKTTSGGQAMVEVIVEELA